MIGMGFSRAPKRSLSHKLLVGSSQSGGAVCVSAFCFSVLGMRWEIVAREKAEKKGRF